MYIWVHKDSAVATEENLGLNSGYVMTQQWVRKRTCYSAVSYIGNKQWAGYIWRRTFKPGTPSLSLILPRSFSPTLSVTSVVELHAPNSVSLFLQIPMYVLITLVEVLFSISGLEFAYSPVHTHNPAHYNLHYSGLAFDTIR